MPVVENQLKRTGTIVITPQSMTVTKNISLGTLSTDEEDWDAAKALAITNALMPCINGSFSDLRTTPTYSIEEE